MLVCTKKKKLGELVRDKFGRSLLLLTTTSATVAFYAIHNHWLLSCVLSCICIYIWRKPSLESSCDHHAHGINIQSSRVHMANIHPTSTLTQYLESGKSVIRLCMRLLRSLVYEFPNILYENHIDDRFYLLSKLYATQEENPESQ